MDFEVWWMNPISLQTYTSKVYAIDTARDRFLVVNDSGHFTWIPISSCMLRPEDEMNNNSMMRLHIEDICTKITEIRNQLCKEKNKYAEN